MGWRPPEPVLLEDPGLGGSQPPGAYLDVNSLDIASDTWNTVQGLVAKHLPVGDIMKKKKPHWTTRLLWNNKNGYQLYDRFGGEFFEDCQTIGKLQVDYVGIQEPNLDTTKSSVNKKVHQACMRAFEHHKVTVGSTPLEHLNEYKPGGTLSLVTGRTVGRVVSSESDYLGRWTRTVMTGKDGKRISIYNVYTPCDKDPTKAGDRSVLAQMYAIYVQEERPSWDPRRNHYHDLSARIKQDAADGHSLIIGGDFNQDLTIGEKGMAKLVQECQLVDPIFVHHGISNFNTYIRGSKVIDYVFVSEDLLDSIDACGYHPFCDHFYSDHRATYLDFNTKKLFGSTTVDLPKPSERGIHSKKRHQVTDYMQAKNKYLKDQKFFSRFARFNKEPTQEAAEKLDRTLLEACKIAADRCKAFPPLPYSPALVQLRLKFHILTIALFALQSGLDVQTQIGHRMDQITDPAFRIPSNVQECKKRKKEARKVLRQAEREEYRTHKLRQEYQLELQAQYEADGDHRLANIVKRLRNAEATRRAWQKCAVARGKVHGSGVTNLEVPANSSIPPKECNDWMFVEEPEEIESHLQAHLRKHFHQAEETDFRSEAFLREDTDFSASTAAADSILDGDHDYCPFEMRLATTRLLRYMTKDKVEDIPVTLTPAQFDGKLKSWNERTSTSPSGLHLGHWKALYADHSLEKESEEGQEIEALQKQLRGIRLRLLNYALEQGFAYQRWNKIVNALIPKDEGSTKIHRLRVIHIYEADYNLILGVKWRELLHHAARNGLINKNQFGSVPGRSAIDLCYMEELEYEISKCCLHPLIKNDNDAASCYDRILMYLASLMSRKRGMPVQVCKVNGMNLEAAKYHIKTMLGTSVSFIAHTEAQPWHGSGQGAGNSPTLWLFISSTLFDCFEDYAHGATFATPDGSKTVKLFMTGFVDDTNSRTNCFNTNEIPTIEELVTKAEKDAQWWSDLLWTSGGKLEPKKCSYHHLRYEFQKNGCPVLVQGNKWSPPLAIKSTDGSITHIKQMANEMDHKSLGCHKGPSGELKAQLQALQEKAEFYTRVIKSSPLNRREANMFQRSIVLSSMCYPLDTTYFKDSILDKVQSKPRRAALQKMGYCSNTSKAICYGSWKYGCIDLHRFADKQGIGLVQQFLKHWRTRSTDIGELSEIALAWVQFHSGLGTSLLEDVVTDAHLPVGIFACLRRFLNSIDATIEVHNPHIPPRQREQDSYIMDWVGQHGGFTPSQIKRINYVRLYFQVVTVADIATADGTAIRPEFWWGKASPLQPECRNFKRFQERPRCKRSWGLWRKALKIFAPKNKVLTVPLGKWLVSADKLRMRHRFFYEVDTGFVYQRCKDNDEMVWAFYHKVQGKTGVVHRWEDDHETYFHLKDDTTKAVPLDPKITRTVKTHGGLDLDKFNRRQTITVGSCYTDILHVCPPPPSPTTFDDFLETLEPWELALFEEIEWSQGPLDVLQLMQHWSFLVASDGGADLEAGKASFGWVIASVDGTIVAQGAGPVFGYLPTSYRAEAYGVLAPTRLILRLTEFFQCEFIQPYTHLVDNQSVNGKCAKCLDYEGWYPNDTLKSDWDVLQQVEQTFREAKQAPTMEHIKSHQDKNRAIETLPIKAQLNCRADKLAGAYMAENTAVDHSTVHRFPVNLAQLHLPDGTCTYKLPRTLRDLRNDPAVLEYLIQHNSQWDDITPTLVDWTVHGRAVNRHEARKTTLVKLLYDMLPVGERVHTYDKKYDHRCPHCSEAQESAEHLYRCTHEDPTLWRTTMQQAVSKKLRNNDTDPILLDIALKGLECHFADKHLYPGDFPERYDQLIVDQNHIGWYNFMRGRLAKQWIKIQDGYLHHTKNHCTKKNGTTWATNLAHLLLEQWFKLWDERNAARHGRDLQQQWAKKQAQLQREVELLYEQADEAPLHLVHSIFKRPLEEQMALSASDIKAWLANWMPVVDREIRQQSQLAAAFYEATATLEAAFASDRDDDEASRTNHDQRSAPSKAGDTCSLGSSSGGSISESSRSSSSCSDNSSVSSLVDDNANICDDDISSDDHSSIGGSPRRPVNLTTFCG